ncbi:aminoglycoside phosphotransferase [Janibacter alittae]|uniref:Aminoglycoside phosphotransferase n=1 Tax=Janibacter alittae TaxID=3115209 RepID=A0ABZ2MER4_9MICO
MRPTEHVLDMFAVPGDTEPVPGGQGRSVRAGDLVLSPDRDAATAEAIAPVLARLAADLDTRAGRDHRDLRIAMPVPARDGCWVIDGWAATRYEPGAVPLTDLAATRAVGAVLHAELAVRVPAVRLPHRRDRWARAERVAFGEAPVTTGTLGSDCGALVRTLIEHGDDTPLGPDQLVHGDLAGNVLLDPRGAPIVIDVSAYRRPVLWAEALLVLDSVLWHGADPAVMQEWATGAAGGAMARAAAFRLLSDRPADVPAYTRALDPLLT